MHDFDLYENLAIGSKFDIRKFDFFTLICTVFIQK